MNILIAIIGAILIVVAAVRGMVAHAKEQDKLPKHGAQRIVKQGNRYWIESYSAFPSWNRSKRFDSLDEARAEKAIYDKLLDPKEEPVIVD